MVEWAAYLNVGCPFIVLNRKDMEFQNINNKDNGLQVRTKLNTMLKGLINGSEGVNEIFKRLSSLTKQITTNKTDVDNKYADLTAAIQQNTEYIDTKVAKIELETLNNKGYFDDSVQLKNTWPRAAIGNMAYVGVNYPYQIWKWGASGWYNTGQTGGSENVPLNNYLTYEDLGEV